MIENNSLVQSEHDNPLGNFEFLGDSSNSLGVIHESHTVVWQAHIWKVWISYIKPSVDEEDMYPGRNL